MGIPQRVPLGPSRLVFVIVISYDILIQSPATNNLTSNLLNSTKRWTLKDFEIGKPLGRGKFGDVYLARERKSKFIVAIKVSINRILRAYDLRCRDAKAKHILLTCYKLQAIKKRQLLQAGVEHQLRREIEIQSHLR